MSTDIAEKTAAPVSFEGRVPDISEKPPIDPHPLSPYVSWAGHRNRGPILEVFKQIFPKSGNALELASGSGLHINTFAPHFPDVAFQPSDYDTEVFDAIDEKRTTQGNANVLAPIRIDLTDPASWPDPAEKLYDAIFVINIFQVAPLAIADGIAGLGARLLAPGGFIAIYGPFKVDGGYTTPSNEDFDKTLLSTGVTEWHLKDVRDIAAAAERQGLKLSERLDLPANNFILKITRP